MSPDAGRTYRAAGAWGWFLRVGSILLIGGGIVCACFAAHDPEPQARTVGVPLCLATSLLGVYGLASVVRFRLVIGGDSIEIRGWRTRLLRVQELAGWRTLDKGMHGPSDMVFVLRGERSRRVRVPRIFAVDDFFRDWISGIPNLDERDCLESEREIIAGPEIADSEEARFDAWERSRRFAKWVNAAGVVIAVAAGFYPQPYTVAIAILAALPWIAVLIVGHSRGLLRLDEYKHDAHPSLIYMLLAPTLALSLRAVLDFECAAWDRSALVALVIGAVLWFAERHADPSIAKRRGSSAAMLLFAVWYGFGAASKPTPCSIHPQAPSVRSP